MSNSFYNFFSTTSLLLASILAIIGTALWGIYELLKKSKLLEKKFKNKKLLKRINISMISLSITSYIFAAIIGVYDLFSNSKKAKYEGIFVTPYEIIVPSDANRPNVPVIITNNYPFPVYAILEIIVKEGPLDLSTDVSLPLYGGGIWGSKYYSCQLPGIIAGSSFTFFVGLDGGKYKQASRIELSINSFTKESLPNFTRDSMKTLPEKFEVPEGFIPKMFKNGL